MQNVFISYSRRDLNFAERLARDLQDAGMNIWIDFRSIRGGDAWRDAIYAGIRQANILLVCLSEDSVESEWVRREIQMARYENLRIVPLIVLGQNADDSLNARIFERMPSYDETRELLDLHVLDFGLMGYERAFPLLLESLIGDQSSVSPRTDAIDPAAIPNPFKGLEAFQETDAKYFFGRGDLIDKMLQRIGNVQTGRFLAVLGASGSGKSSVVRAGLIPALRAGKLPHSDGWILVTFTPGVRPLEALATRLLPIVGKGRLLPEIITLLEGGQSRLHQLVEQALMESEPTARLALFVDQFEEVFTRAPRTQAEIFLDLLYTAATQVDGRTQVIITMRSDFFDRLGSYPRLARLFEQENIVIVTEMTAPELRQSIVEPAKAVGLTYDDDLVSNILEDVQSQPGSLPLLQYALKELYKRRQGSQLTSAAYATIGGVQGALARHAEEIYERLNAEQQNVMRRVLLRLVEVSESGEATRRRIDRHQIRFRDVSDSAIQDVIDLLVAPETRLLVANRHIGQITSDEQEPAILLEVSHEALIREWDRYQEWIASDVENLRLDGTLLKAAQQWENSDFDPAYLFAGTRLEQAERWLIEADVTDLQRRFIETSLIFRRRQIIAEQERRERELQIVYQGQVRQRYLLTGVLFAGFLLFGCIGIYLLSFVLAPRQADPIVERSFSNLPIRYNTTDTIITNTRTSSVRAVVRAPRSVLEIMTPDDIVIRADLSEVGPGVHSIRLQADTSRNGVMSVDSIPQTITVSVEAQRRRLVPVRLVQQGIIPGFEVSTEPQETSVEVVGPVSQVDLVSATQAIIHLSPSTTSTEDVELAFALVAIDGNNQAVEGVVVEPATVTVQMTFEQRPNTRVLRLDPMVINAPPVGYRVTNIEITPGSIMVQGEPEALAALDDPYEVGPIDVSGLIGSLQLQIPVTIAEPDVQVLNAREVRIVVGIEANQPETENAEP